MVRNPGLHSGRNANGLVNPAEVVPRHIQGDGGFMVGEFLGMGVGEPGEAAQMHPQRKVTAFDVAGGDMAVIRVSGNGSRDYSDDVTRRAVPFGTPYARFRENLGDLREINIRPIKLLDRADVASQSIRGDLKPAERPSAEIAHEVESVDRIPVANVEGKHQLGIAVQCKPRIGVSPLCGRIGSEAPLMAADKTPDLIRLHVSGPDAANVGIEHALAMLAGIDHQGHDGVFVHAGKTGNGADAHSLKHHAENLCGAVNIRVVVSERLGGRIGESSLAGAAAVTLDSPLAVDAEFVGCIVLAADACHIAFPLKWGEESGTIGLGLECGLPRVLDLAPPRVGARSGARLTRLRRRFYGDFHRVTCRGAGDSDNDAHRGFRLSESAPVSDSRRGASHLILKLNPSGWPLGGWIRLRLMSRFVAVMVHNHVGETAGCSPTLTDPLVFRCSGVWSAVYIYFASFYKAIDRGSDRRHWSLVFLKWESEFPQCGHNLGGIHPSLTGRAQRRAAGMRQAAEPQVKSFRVRGIVAEFRPCRNFPLLAGDLDFNLFALLEKMLQFLCGLFEFPSCIHVYHDRRLRHV